MINLNEFDFPLTAQIKKIRTLVYDENYEQAWKYAKKSLRYYFYITIGPDSQNFLTDMAQNLLLCSKKRSWDSLISLSDIELYSELSKLDFLKKGRILNDEEIVYGEKIRYSIELLKSLFSLVIDPIIRLPSKPKALIIEDDKILILLRNILHEADYPLD